MKGSGNSVQPVTSLLEGRGWGRGRRPLTGDIMAVTWADISSFDRAWGEVREGAVIITLKP